MFPLIGMMSSLLGDKQQHYITSGLFGVFVKFMEIDLVLFKICLYFSYQCMISTLITCDTKALFYTLPASLEKTIT